jgi:hypothetical protein
MAFSLFLFIRDCCAGDLVAFIDKCLEAVDSADHPDRIARMRHALLSKLSIVYGVSSKLISMSFADLLIGADPGRPRWREVGVSLVAVDTLVHNFLHRSGILKTFHADHAFGPACYGKTGCAAIIDACARDIDCRAFDPSYPEYFPRFVQHALWRYCAQGGLNICNGNRIDDSRRCRNEACRLYANCSRIPLFKTTQLKGGPHDRE